MFMSNLQTREQSALERMPPDTTACIFWLKNRNPEEWRDKTQVEPSWASKRPSEMTDEELDAAYLALQRLLPSPETVNTAQG
jgi:hypothetical protein